METTLYFVRHGETDWNAEKRMQGQWESTLTERGRGHAEANAALVAALGVDALYASPLQRTRESAAPLAAMTGLSPAFDDRLKEWDAGDWSGVLYAEIPGRWPVEWAAWRADMWRVRAPGGENLEDLTDRGGAFLDEMLTREAGRRAAIVSHGFIGRAMIARLAGLAPDDALKLHTANDVVFRLRGGGDDWRCDRFEAGRGPADGLFADEAGGLA